MPNTGLALELEITQENIGHANHLVFLAPLWKEVLDFDTYAEGAGTTVAKIVDGSAYDRTYPSVIAGVANTGSDRNWCGHHFAQANWYAFGRLAWDPLLTSAQIAGEWSRMTFGNNAKVVSAATAMLLGSHDAYVNYTMPLGIAHIMEGGDHYDPAPAAWRGYHNADSTGIGFDRSSTGSDAVSQYYTYNREIFDNLKTCPEKYLLWFHHVPYSYRLSSGRTILEELFACYDSYYPNVLSMIAKWESLHDDIDAQRFREVSDKLQVQLIHAKKWRDTCVTYFAKVSGQPYEPTPVNAGRAVRLTPRQWKVRAVPGELHLSVFLPGATAARNARIELFDLNGRLVGQKTFSATDGEAVTLRMPARSLAAGSYVCRLSVDGKGCGVRRVISSRW
jgi:alpha-glucuronidase